MPDQSQTPTDMADPPTTAFEHAVPHVPAQPLQTDSLALIARAVERGVAVDQLERLMDLHERVLKSRALEAFNRDLAACQGQMPAIPQNGQNNSTKKKYATWEALNQLIKPVYVKYGFSLVFGEIIGGGSTELMHMYVDVSHVGGHVKRVEGLYPRDKSGQMNAIQGTGSTHSYAKRYLAKDVFCLAEVGEDNDGQDAAKLTPEQVKEIKDLLARSQSDVARFLKWAGATKVEDILAKDYAKVGDTLERACRKAGV